VAYLKKELARGEKDIERVAALRDECMGRAWSQDNIQTKYKSPQLTSLPISLPFRSHSSFDTTIRPTSSK
jgi:hypothetical protein